MKKFQIIYCDVPWSYNDPKGNDSAMGGIQYNTMSNQELADLPINEIADKDCLLFQWITMPKLSEVFSIIEAWGFRYITCAFTWVKLNPTGSIEKDGKDIILKKGIYSGIGHYSNGNAELCLLAKKGHPKRYEKNVKQIQIHPRGKHSAKPLAIKDEIVRLAGDLPRIELFARNLKKFENGWVNIGYEITGNDIREDLKKLIK
ncbi:MAG: MT-A70 family methyltransferase [Promethearchaeia archaeon]